MKYFAYGSNMDVEQMKGRCPDAKVLDLAVLQGASFRINRYGVATVVPSTSIVHGVLWEISSGDATNLSAYEGEAGEFYLKESVWVEFPRFKKVEAMIYLAGNIQPGKPRPGYLELILRAAKAHGFPREYFSHLASCADHRANGIKARLVTDREQ